MPEKQSQFHFSATAAPSCFRPRLRVYRPMGWGGGIARVRVIVGFSATAVHVRDCTMIKRKNKGSQKILISIKG